MISAFDRADPPDSWLRYFHRDQVIKNQAFVSIFVILSGMLVFVFLFLGLIEGRQLAQWFVAMTGTSLCIAGIVLWVASPALSLTIFVLFLGNAAQLYVTDPLWYNELIFPPTSAFTLAMYLFLVPQISIATIVIVANSSWDTVLKTIHSLGLIRIGIFLLLGLGFSVSILNYLRIDALPAYYFQLVAYGVVLVVNLVTVWAVYSSQSDDVGGLERFLSPLGLIAFAFFTSVAISWFAFEKIGHVDDEYSYFFQARTFAGGALWVPSLPTDIQPAFEHFQLMFDNGRWFSALAPGWPAVLAVGVLLNAPWLVNPILGAASVALGYTILLRFLGRQFAIIGCLLLATSPWLIGLSATFMTHALSLFVALVAWQLLLIREGRQANARTGLAFIAGLAMGWLFLTRPLDGIIVGSLTGLFLFFLRSRQPLLTGAVPFGLGSIATGSLIFPYNAAMTGEPLKPPMSYYFEATWEKLGFANRLGFGPEIGPPEGYGILELTTPGHSVYEGFINVVNNINSLHTDLFGWIIGSLTFIWVYALWGRVIRQDLFALAVIGSVVAAYFFYWFAGSIYVGPRYWYLAIVPFVFLTIRGITTVVELLSDHTDLNQQNRFLNCVIILCICSSVVFLSYRGVSRFHHFMGYHSHFRDLKLEHQNGVAPLVIFKGDVGNIGSAYFLNDPFLAPENPVFAKDLGPDGNKALSAAFPNRPVVYVDRTLLNLQ